MISIIIPVYNVEKYLFRCLKSIIVQTYIDFECIMVNDGSTDKSYEICESFVKQDTRFKLLSKENGGLSSARNYGLDYATGEYIFFLDSDDYVSKECLNTLITNIGNSEICSGSYYPFKNDVLPNLYNIINEKLILTPKETYQRALNSMSPNIFAWNKLYKKNLFDNVRYRNVLYEDIDIFFEIIQQCSSVCCISSVTYFYNIGNINSITAKKITPKDFDAINNALNLTEKITSSYPDLNRTAKKYLTSVYFHIFKRIISSKAINTNLIQLKSICIYLKENIFSLLFQNKLNIKTYFKIAYFYFFLTLCTLKGDFNE